MKKKLVILLGIFLLFVPFGVQAVQPTQHFNKIQIYPYYTENLASNTNYTYNLVVNPPDGVTSIVTAIIFFKAQISGQTQNFTLLINGKPCNNPFYYVSTAFSTTGNMQFDFDCSNIIKNSGNYTITLRSTANTGVVTGWLDLTYMNNPNPVITISGTEYISGDNGTVFLQLLNSSNQAVNNALCYLKMYYPNKTILFNNVQMAYYIGSDGLYYYDFVVPNTEGVYMMSANCNFYNNLTYRTGENDTYVNSDANTTNYGNLTYFNIGRNGNTTFYYGYVQFNMTNLTAGGLISAELYLYQSIGLVNVPVVTAQRVTSVWNESNVTWNTKPTNDVYIWDRQAVSSGWYKWNITGLVNGWINGSYTNYGVFLNISPSAGTLNYTTPQSRESGGAYMPYLLIQYYSNEQINEIRGSGEAHVSNTLLSAINSVNATANQNLNYLITINGSVFNLSQAEFSHYNNVIDFLSSINTTLNTTLEYKLDLINGTVFQINQSQTAYYLSLLGAIGSVEATLNASIIGVNSSLTQYLVLLDNMTYNLSINEFNHYLSLLEAINSVNFTVNTTLENKIDYLNNTVIPFLELINSTTIQNLILTASVNQSLLDDYISLYNLLSSVNGNVQNLNSSEFQHFQDLYVILKDINYTTNSTLEYKLDLINYTTWQSWLLLQNLTIGNVSVAANVNWTEGYLETSVLSFSDQINNEGIELFTETLTCLSNTTLQHWFNGTKCIQGVCHAYNETVTEFCNYGCAASQCIPAPHMQYFYALGIIFLLVGVIYAVWKGGK